MLGSKRQLLSFHAARSLATHRVSPGLPLDVCSVPKHGIILQPITALQPDSVEPLPGAVGAGQRAIDPHLEVIADNAGYAT